MRAILAILLAILTFLSVIYIAFWWGIIDPILTVADAIDNDTVTASLVAWEVCKFFLKEIVAGIVAVIGFSTAKYLIEG